MAKNTPAPEPQPEQAPVPSLVDLAVDAWFVDNFYNAGPDLTPALFNRYSLAKDDLKRRLQALTR